MFFSILQCNSFVSCVLTSLCSTLRQVFFLHSTLQCLAVYFSLFSLFFSSVFSSINLLVYFHPFPVVLRLLVLLFFHLPSLVPRLLVYCFLLFFLSFLLHQIFFIFLQSFSMLSCHQCMITFLYSFFLLCRPVVYYFFSILFRAFSSISSAFILPPPFRGVPCVLSSFPYLAVVLQLPSACL